MKKKTTKKSQYLLVDFNQIMLLALFAMRKHERDDEILEWTDDEIPKQRLKPEVFENQFRNFFWNMLIGIAGKFDNVAKVILCLEDVSWRKKVFPYYKAKRATTRNIDTFDWKFFYEMLNDFRVNELDKYSPFISMKCYECEGDDIIATLGIGLSEMYPDDEVIIYSSDKDFVQLLSRPNIKIYSPLKKKYVSSTNPKNDLLQLILTGDSSDGIPNVYNRDDAYVNPEKDANGKTKRMKPLGEVTVRKAIVNNDVYTSIIKTPEIQKNFDRNKLLIDLEMIPKNIKDRIKEEYKKQLKLSETKSPAELQRYFAREGLGNVAASLSKIVHLF